MAKLAKWMPSLLNGINLGCSTSPILSTLSLENKDLMSTAREICHDLWPFIRELPQNISYLRDSLPTNMNAARQLLNQLADEEGHFKQLYIKQCLLSGLLEHEMACSTYNEATVKLCNVVRQYCQSGKYSNGIYAIITAELAATAFSRIALPVFEKYFDMHKHAYNMVEVASGLEWLRVHCKPQTRHALWLKRMLNDIDEVQSDIIPESAEAVLSAVLELWKCPPQADKTQTNKNFSTTHPI